MAQAEEKIGGSGQSQIPTASNGLHATVLPAAFVMSHATSALEKYRIELQTNFHRSGDFTFAHASRIYRECATQGNALRNAILSSFLAADLQ
jgi:hypothetical protein